ncbi:MAG TPA: hypothetical protein VFL76_03325 [Edaphocola sp.]|nr:hypothetical protein [Edaphocola sp.]
MLYSGTIRLLIIVFALTLLPHLVLAQDLSGMVIDMTDQGGIANVIIRNKNTDRIAYSDNRGHFSIKAQKGDSILFFSQGYFPARIMMPGNGEISRTVPMKRKEITLHEISIRPGWTAYQLDSIERRQIYSGALDQKKTTSVFSPVSLLADNVSRKGKQRWRFQKNYAQWEQQKFIDTRYAPEEVHKLTGLQGDSLAAFMNAFPIAYDYARTASDLEVKMWIRYNFRQWIKHPYVPDLPDVKFADSSRLEGR